MKQMKHLLNVIMSLGIAMFAMSACSSSDDMSENGPVNPSDNETQTISMRLNGTLMNYTGEKQAKVFTRASSEASYDWNDGDVLYLQFVTDNGVIPGQATYKKSEGDWTVTYSGKLPENVQKTCKAFYFDGALQNNTTNVQLNEHTAIYLDSIGTYSLKDKTLTVNATLSPMTGRMHFKGDKGTTFAVIGITHYTGYDVKTNKFYTDYSMIKDTVMNDGLSKYVYGTFTTSESPVLAVAADKRYFYTMRCAKDLYVPGASGYFTVPTDESHNGWEYGITVNVNGVDYKMLPVKYGTSNILLMGETELTQEQYYNLMNGDITDPNSPIVSVSYETFQTFLKKLNAACYLNFRLPTLDEWTYAAEGGAKSMGYIFSGSNIADNVAWYTSNSGDKIQKVAQKQPNELGLYDMSGNVWEWTSTKYSTSASYSYYACGGCCANDTTRIKVNSTFYKYTDGNYYDGYIGIRLALTLK